MKEKSLIISLMLFVAIMVQPFFASSSEADGQSRLIIDEFTTNLVDNELLLAISNHVRDYILKSGQYEITVKDDAAAAGGGLRLAGSLVKLGTKFIINMRLEDIDTGKIIKKARASTNQEELLNSIDNAISSMLGIADSGKIGLKSATDGFGFLQLKSKPVGASILLDGEDVGITPRTLESLKSGKYSVKLIKDGFFAWEKEIEIGAGSVINVMAELKTVYGSLRLNSSPPGADVYVDGDYAGKTPLQLDTLEGGEYDITIELKGYELYTEMVHVEAGVSRDAGTILDETEAHKKFRLAREKRIKKNLWVWGSLTLGGIMALKASTDYSESKDAYSKADDAYLKYQNSTDAADIAYYRNMTDSYEGEGTSKAQDGDMALFLAGSLFAASLYNFYTMPPMPDYEETAFIYPEIRGDAMFLAWKTRY